MFFHCRAEIAAVSLRSLLVARAIVCLMSSRGAVHDRQIRSAFVQFCLRHGIGSGSGICAATGLPHKSATCTGSTRRLEPQIMLTTRETSIFRRNSRLNIVAPLFDYLSVPNAPFRRVFAITSTLVTVSGRLRRGPKVVSSRAELIPRNVRCALNVACWAQTRHGAMSDLSLLCEQKRTCVAATIKFDLWLCGRLTDGRMLRPGSSKFSCDQAIPQSTTYMQPSLQTCIRDHLTHLV